MPDLFASDGTKLCYHERGDGSPLICLPGGPMTSSDYLGDLGGLSEQLRLILMDHRGTGGSGIPTDPLSYRCDRLVDDVEALREQLGIERVDLLAHSGGANLAVLYAARHPDRVAKLVLVTPSTWALGVEITVEDRRRVVQLRTDEPWFAQSSAAFEAVNSGQGADGDWEALVPFTYGRWDAAAKAHYDGQLGQRNDSAAERYGEEGVFDPPATRAALTALESPVLLLAGERDVGAPPAVMATVAALFPYCRGVTQPGAGHYPWLDDPLRFRTTVMDFLA